MIPFVDLKRQYQQIKYEVDAAVLKVIENAEFVLGREVGAFEEEFAAYCGATYAIGCNSGTSALHLALLAAGVQPGDEVITVPYTFVATTAAIRYAGARPVYVDIDPVSYTMNASQIEAAITERTKAIMPVHLYGQPADMDPILEVARRRNLAVIEDAAQAHGADYKGRRCGSMGELGAFSFYPGKNLGAYGEGGCVTTSNPEFARKIRMLRDWGAEKKYHHVLKGFNYRLEGIQGAVLRVKLRYLDEWTEMRRRNARSYDELLAGAEVITPAVMPYTTRHVFHVYTILSGARDQLAARLQERGIQTNIHYPLPIHLMEAHRDLGYPEGAFPEAERISTMVLSLPMFAELTRGEMEEVAQAVGTAAVSSGVA